MEESATAPHAWAFQPTSKVPSVSHRTVAPRETLERVRTCAKDVPITRVSDLTPIDRLRLPVFSATTPLARDLTTHMGKGNKPQKKEVKKPKQDKKAKAAKK